MSEIQLLTDQIEILYETLRPLSTKFMGLMMSGFFATAFGLMFGWLTRNIGLYGLGVLGVVMLIIGFGVIYPSMSENQTEYSELITQRSEMIRSEIMAMECEPMRLDIIHKIENEQEWFMKDHYDFEKDLYYHRCEIPLRSEILKLQ